MSGQTPVRLPLSDRQADALGKLLDEFGSSLSADPAADVTAALREVAGKLDTLREQS